MTTRHGILLVIFRPDTHQLHVKGERRVWRDDVAGTPVAVRSLRRTGHPDLLIDTHTDHALVPALDDKLVPGREGERRVPRVGRVKLGTVHQVAAVVDVRAVSLRVSRGIVDACGG